MTTSPEPVPSGALAVPLRAVIEAVEAGDLSAGASARSFLAGALAALEAASEAGAVDPPTDTSGH